MLFTNVVIILGEEKFGTYPAPNFGFVLLLNLSWLLFPVIITARMWRSETPFTAKQAVG
jgi:hypothetical protein